MADTVASSSDPCAITTLRPLTLIQPLKILEQAAMRVGSNSANATATRYFSADRWTAWSKDVWSNHVMHCNSNAIVR